MNHFKSIGIKISVGLTLILPGLAGSLSATARQERSVPQQAAELLSAQCLKCHDEVKKAGGIDLTSRSAAQSRDVFTAGIGGTSRIERAVASGKMPPTGRLPAADIALVKRWVAGGAVYPAAKLEAIRPAASPLWSFQPVRFASPPRTPFDALSNNLVDRFVFAKLAERGLKPSLPADKRTLLRRVTIDLTGLPPTPEEMDAFLKDQRPDAYERVVDRLLASPAYGECWGRHWLDVVRYGESNGYEQNHLRPNAWPYRDYVIHAFNQDTPYPRFIAEQLAGDVLAKEDPDATAATGFLVAGIHDTVGNSTEEGTRQQRANDLEDMVSTTGAAFLGLTVGCAKCHDHKFDPIPQRDFYRFAACFAGVRHGERPLHPPTEAQKQELAQANQRLSEIQNAINDLDNQARTVVLKQRGTNDSSRPAVNARHNEDTFPALPARFVRCTILATNDGAEPCLDELQVFGPDSPKNVALASNGGKATASSLLPGYAIHQIAHLNDGKFGNEWSWISNTRGTGWARIELAAVMPINRVVWSRDGAEIPRFDDRLPVSYRIETSLDGSHWQTVSSEAGRTGSQNYIHPDELRKVMTPEQRTRRAELQAELGAQKQKIESVTGSEQAYIGQFSAPDPIYVLRRGDVMQRGDVVTPGALSQITSLNTDLLASQDAPEPERRMALARWIGDARNPLTARVLVNRVWQYHFGRGIVGTPSDFGRNGEKPTHPELLDWLASEFMQDTQQPEIKTKTSNAVYQPNQRPSSSAPKNTKYHIPNTADPYACGWRLKALHRLLVTSYTYRQCSTDNPVGMAKDAGNTLLWRMPLRRMEAEGVRDAILATSGKLDRRMGGPSFRLFKYNVVNVAIYEPLDAFGPETWRRSVYQQAARSIRDDLLGAFDCPESSQRAPRRDTTTTALQALSLLNGPFLTQQSGFFADRVVKEAGNMPSAQVKRTFQLAFARLPDAAEEQAALQLTKRDGLNMLCRALLNANEFLYY